MRGEKDGGWGGKVLRREAGPRVRRGNYRNETQPLPLQCG